LVDGVGEEHHGYGSDPGGSGLVVFRAWSRFVDNVDDDEAAGHEEAGDVEGWSAVPFLGEEEDVSGTQG